MTTLIIGNKGMLGSDVQRELTARGIKVTGWDLAEIDITQEEEMAKIKDLNPTVIINCAAYTNVDRAEDEGDFAWEINAKGTHHLASISNDLDIPLVHISTDYVFDGCKESYLETDQKLPLNAYGATKAEGEDTIIATHPKHYIIRTSWLFGKDGKNFVTTMIRLMTERESLNVVADQYGKPTYTKDLARAIADLIEEAPSFGIYHLINEESCTWYAFACEIAKQIGSPCTINSCTSEQYPTRAKRPAHSVLINTKRPLLRSWRAALTDYLKEINTGDTQ